MTEGKIEKRPKIWSIKATGKTIGEVLERNRNVQGPREADRAHVVEAIDNTPAIAEDRRFYFGEVRTPDGEKVGCIMKKSGERSRFEWHSVEAPWYEDSDRLLVRG